MYWFKAKTMNRFYFTKAITENPKPSHKSSRAFVLQWYAENISHKWFCAMSNLEMELNFRGLKMIENSLTSITKQTLLNWIPFKLDPHLHASWAATWNGITALAKILFHLNNENNAPEWNMWIFGVRPNAKSPPLFTLCQSTKLYQLCYILIENQS